MKKLLLSLILSSITLIGHTQNHIKVSFDISQDITWPLNLSLKQSQDSDLVKYPQYTTGNNIFNFDLLSKTLTVIYKSEVVVRKKFSRIDREGSDYFFEYESNNGISPGKILIAKKDDNNYTLIVQEPVKKEDKEFNGYFSENVNIVFN